MKKSQIFFPFMILSVFLMFNFAIAQVIPPKARGTPSGGPTIEEAHNKIVILGGMKAVIA